MRGQAQVLVNTPEIELWPGGLLRARSNHDARTMARARRVLRRKRDGQYLAADLPEGLLPLVHRLAHEPGMDAALDALQHFEAHLRAGADRIRDLPLDRLHNRLDALGLDDDYVQHTGLPLVAEPDRLVLAGLDRYRRSLWLLEPAARAWSSMRAGVFI